MSRHCTKPLRTFSQCRDIDNYNFVTSQIGQPTYIRMHFVEIFKFKSNLSSFLTLYFSKSPINKAMSNLSSLTLDEVIRNVVEEVLRERTEEGNQETSAEVVPEEIKVMVEEG